LRFLGVAVPGRADDQRSLVFGANGREARGRIVKTEINHYIRLLDQRQQIIAQINLANDLQLRIGFRAGDQRLTHAPFGAGDDEFDWLQS